MGSSPKEREKLKETVDAKLKKDLPAIFKRHPAVLSAYVFGSAAIGRRHRRSDVDIAVRLDDRLTPEAAFDLKLKLSGALEALLGCRVDLVILNTASLQLIHQVMQGECCVYVTRPDEETAYRLQKQKAYFDFQYTLRDDREALRAFFKR
jgi:predicted nucleotidyltransferase